MGRTVTELPDAKIELDLPKTKRLTMDGFHDIDYNREDLSTPEEEE